MNAQRIGLLDHPELLRELRGLERRRGSSGRDRADHRPGSHDDAAVAATLALVRAAAGRERTAEDIAIDLKMLRMGHRQSSEWDADGEPVSIEDYELLDDGLGDTPKVF